MKIAGTHGPHMTGAQKEIKHTRGKNGDFKTVMDQAMNKGNPSIAQSPNVMGAPMVEGITPLKPSGLDPVSSAIGEVEDMLDRLDFYAEKLKDESIRSDDLLPLLDDMESGIQKLEQIITRHDVPQRLEEIVSDLLGTVGAEVEKFRRGDYL